MLQTAGLRLPPKSATHLIKLLMRRHLFSFVFLIPFICSCSVINEGISSSRNPTGFICVDSNIYIERETDRRLAEDIRALLPAQIASIETRLDCKFREPPALYICATNESFCKWSGAKYPGPRARVTARGLFISPRLLSGSDRFAIIHHELVHSLLFQYLRGYRYYTIPLWFHEGLATSVSDGGGTGDITDRAAIDEIVKGNHFYPHAGFIRSYLSKTGMQPWLEYRQYMLFVRFLENSGGDEFRALLRSLLEEKPFPKSFREAYGKSTSMLWNEFVESSK